MQEAATFTPEEQKYFDTNGADGPANDGTPPETPAAAPTDAAKPVETPEKTEDPSNPGQFIRRSDYDKEVSHRRNLDKALREERDRNIERNARLQERLDQMQGWLSQPQQQEEQPIDPRQDLPGFLQQQSREVQELRQWRDQETQQRQQTQQQQQQYTALKQAVEWHEAEFTKEHADYQDAIQFGMQLRIRELTEVYGFPSHVAQQILQDDVQVLANTALQQGRSPAEAAYTWAKMRGYVGPTPAQPTPADTAAKAMTDAAAKLSKIASGQSAGKSLGAASGSATPELTLQSLADMPDDEFAKIALDKSKWRKLMGG